MSDLGQTQDKAINRAYIALIKAIDDNDGSECAQLPDVFYPYEHEYSSQTDIRLAKAICGRCPIKLTCLEYAVVGNEMHGIFGGLLPRERAQLRHIRRLTS
jgi:hypothetical protein